VEELSFVIQHFGGRVERALVHASRVLVGSGAHCDLRLPPDQAALEHVVIEVTADGARIRRLASSPPSLLDGAPFSIASLGPEATLAVGATVIRVERRVASAKSEESKLGVAAGAKAGVLVVLGCAIAFLATLPQPEVGPPPSQLPDIFASAEPTCARTDPAEARVVAEDSRAVGDGARERSPFEPREAIAAVKAYGVAAACYRVAGEQAAASEVAAQSRDLEEDTRAELRARRVRLERMIAVDDVEVARQDVAVLRALTQGQRGEYVAWLAKIDQELKSKKVEKK